MKKLLALALVLLTFVVVTATAEESSINNSGAYILLQKGSKGIEVINLQTRLAELGFYNIAIDGDYGNGTVNAVKAFEKSEGLEETGVATIELQEMIFTDPVPSNMIIDEVQWEAWTSKNKCKLFPFMGAGKQAGFSFTIPSGQANSSHKKCSFIFNEGEWDNTSLKNVEMYYGVEDQTILYTGLWTEDKDIFESQQFKEACIRLMLGYNIHYDSNIEDTVLNLSHERAEEVVSYCLKNVEHCLVDDMRIRVIRDEEDPYYSFHMEY